MPRADSKQQFYHSQFSSSYLPPSDPSPVTSPQIPSPTSTSTSATPTAATPAPTTTNTSLTNAATTSGPAPKKKHVCPTCERAFTTSGHLARHSRVHTGERNHKCPFPGCETRCSRQDNLQQHYRIHLSPGSRRSSTRSAIARAMNGGKRGSASMSLQQAQAAQAGLDANPNIPPPLSAPPALEPARLYHHAVSPPPDSPPPLAQATLPATAHLPHHHQSHHFSSSRGSSSPEIPSPYTLHHAPAYSYRSGTTTYQEQSQGTAGFTYVHTTPISHPHQGNPSSFTYPPPSHHYDAAGLPQINTGSSSVVPSPASPSIPSLSSRHSISHISHPHPHQSNSSSYSHHPSHHSHSSASPPSPASSHSVSSHTSPSLSGPPTPTTTYSFHDEAQAYTPSNATMLEQGQHMSSNGHHVSPATGHLVASYSPNMAIHSPTMPLSAGGIGGPGVNGGFDAHSRFESPPPILAPIQDSRRGSIMDDQRPGSGHSTSSNANGNSSPTSPYHPHSQQLDGYATHGYGGHQGLGLGPGAWKNESGMTRKGVGALIQ